MKVQEDLLDDIVPCVTYDEEKGTFSKEHTHIHTHTHTESQGWHAIASAPEAESHCVFTGGSLGHPETEPIPFRVLSLEGVEPCGPKKNKPFRCVCASPLRISPPK